MADEAGTSHRTDMDDDPAAKEAAAKLRRSERVAAIPAPEMVVDETAEILRERFLTFLNDFSSAAEGEADLSQMGGSMSQRGAMRDYVLLAQTLKESDTTTLYVDWSHLLNFDAELAETLEVRQVAPGAGAGELGMGVSERGR